MQERGGLRLWDVSRGRQQALTTSDNTWGSNGIVLNGSNQCASGSNLLSTVATASYSVSAEVTKDSAAIYSTCVSQDAVNISAFRLQTDNTGKFMFALPDADSTSAQFGRSTAQSTYTQGRIYRITGVASATGIQLYVDGAPQYEDVRYGIASNGEFLLGAGQWDASRGDYWPGKINWVMAHQRALSAAEARSLHEDPFAMLWEPGLITYSFPAAADVAASGFRPWWASVNRIAI